MEDTIVTTNMIYEFLKEFKADANNRFEHIEKRMDQIEHQQPEDRQILMDIWKSRDKVTVTFSRTFTAVNAFISLLVSAITATVVAK